MVCQSSTTSGEVQRAALALLARREYSAAELKQKLVRKYQKQRYWQEHKRSHASSQQMLADGLQDDDSRCVSESRKVASVDSSPGVSTCKTSTSAPPTGATIDAVLAELLDAGLLSDRRYVENMVRNRAARGYGPNYIAQELRAKGADDSLIDEFLERDTDLWLRHAKDIVRKKMGGASDRDTWLRTARYLQRRGFPSDIVSRALGDPPS